MKKYPFSNKALKTIIAASVTFTPFAAAGTAFQANQVAAAESDYQSVDSFIEYLDRTYERLSTKDQRAIESARQELFTISKDEWVAYAQRVSANNGQELPAGDPQAKQELLSAAVQLMASVQLGDAEGAKEQVKKFRTDQAENINKVFGEDFTEDKVMAFLKDVEYAFLDSLRGVNLDKQTGSYLYGKLVEAVQKTAPQHPIVGKTVLQQIDLNELKLVLQEIAERTDKDGKAREAIKNAIQKVQLPPGSGGGNPPTPKPTPNPTPTPTPGETTPTDDGVIVSPGADVSGDEVIITIKDSLMEEILEAITADKNRVVIDLPKFEPGQTASVLIPAELVDKLKEKASNAVIVIQGEGVSYELQVAEVDTEELAKQLGVPVSELSLKVSASLVPSERALQVTKAVQAKGAKVLSKIVSFEVEAVSNDKSMVIGKIGKRYVNHGFGLSDEVNTNRATGIRIHKDGSFSAVPTRFFSEDGQSKAVVKSLGNAEFAVIESDKTFPDVDKGANWAENYIESLASKYIINGKSNGKYDPNAYVTRAEFAVLLSRALGLPEEKYDGRFKDVKGHEWFNVNGALMAAVKNGVVAGKGNGTFAPNAKISRAEATAMIGRALKLSYIDFDETKLDKNKKIDDFKDAKHIGAALREDMLRAYQAGIVAGTSKGKFEPKAFTKRDQMARILAEFLIKADLMDELK
ncbi:MAG TPA: S-layer homology domain-containing protein [Pseudobacillus sp.]